MLFVPIQKTVIIIYQKHWQNLNNKYQRLQNKQYYCQLFIRNVPLGLGHRLSTRRRLQTHLFTIRQRVDKMLLKIVKKETQSSLSRMNHRHGRDKPLYKHLPLGAVVTRCAVFPNKTPSYMHVTLIWGEQQQLRGLHLQEKTVYFLCSAQGWSFTAQAQTYE